MVRVALVSDTHGFIDEQLLGHLNKADEVWHAGDIGTPDVTNAIAATKPLRGVFGNIDGGALRMAFPEISLFTVEQTKVLMVHIGGSPGRYPARIKALIELHKPQVFVCGHSHILRVVYDKPYNLLHLNPGAAGRHGFHTVRTMLRFSVDGNKLAQMEVIELGPRSSKGV